MAERVFATARATGPIREEELMGHTYQVFPATLVKEQVLNNNLGRTFLPAEEIEASVGHWSGMPVTLGHPKRRGQPTSARDPEVLNDRGAGFVFRPRFDEDDRALKADVFIDPERAENVGALDELMEKVEKGEPAELSTGFGTALEEKEDAHNGERYEKVLRSISPDHLALLDDERGACSVEDGCGLGVNQRSTVRSRNQLAGSGEVSEGELPEWWPATLSRYVDALDLEPTGDADEVNTVSDLSDDDRARLAAHTAVGRADGDTFDEIAGSGTFPWVNPETGEIEENALRASLGGRLAQANLSEDLKGEIEGRARSILNAEDLLETEDAENAESLARRLIEQVKDAFRSENQDEMSLDDIREAVREHLDEMFGAQDRFIHVVELFSDEVVYEVAVQGGEDRLFRAPYEIDEDGEVTLGERTEVEKQVEFVPADNEWSAQTEYRQLATNCEECDMTREEMIAALAEDEDVAFDREALESFDDDQLATVANGAGLGVGDEADTEVENEGEDPEPTAEDADEAEALLEEVESLREKVAELEEATEPAVEEREEERQKLAERLAANERCPFDAEELEGESLPKLRKMAQMARGVNYAGRGGPKSAAENTEERFLAPTPYHEQDEE